MFKCGKKRKNCLKKVKYEVTTPCIYLYFLRTKLKTYLLFYYIKKVKQKIVYYYSL